MFRIARTIVAAIGVSIILAACQATPPAARLPDISFTHLPAVNLKVGQIEVVSIYRSPLASPNVEHEFPTTPDKAMRRWATDRLRATGSATGLNAKFIIINASVIETRLKTEKGVKGLFSEEQAERYEGRVEARLEIFNQRGQRLAQASARADRVRTISEDASLDDRDRIWLEFVERLVGDLDRALEPAIRQHMREYIR